MKKLATILMLAVVLLIGGATVDAKTTKKKATARSTQSTSNDMWNGDIPTGKNLCSNGGWSERGYYKKGYRDMDSLGVIKKGVCSVEAWAGGGSGLVITVYNSAKLNWLYQDLQKANAIYHQYSQIWKNGNEIWTTYR